MHMLSIACGLLFCYSNVLIHQMSGTEEGILVLIACPSPRKYSGRSRTTYSYQKYSKQKLPKAHIKAKET